MDWLEIMPVGGMIAGGIAEFAALLRGSPRRRNGWRMALWLRYAFRAYGGWNSKADCVKQRPIKDMAEKEQKKDPGAA